MITQLNIHKVIHICTSVRGYFVSRVIFSSKYRVGNNFIHWMCTNYSFCGWLYYLCEQNSV